MTSTSLCELGPGRSRPCLRFLGAPLLAASLLAGSAGAVQARDEDPVAPPGVQDPSTEEPQDETLVAVMEILAERLEPRSSPALLRRRLIDLGPEATRAFFALFSGRAKDLGRSAVLDTAGKELLYDAMRSWSSKEVVREIRAQLDEDSPLNDRVVAIRMLGEVGLARAVPAIGEIMLTLGPMDARPPTVRNAIESALRSVLTRDQGAYSEVSELLERVEPFHYPPIVQALGEGGSGRGQPLLESLLGRSTELDLSVLDALGKMDPWDPDAASERCALLVRGYLGVEDPVVRRQAAVSLGRLLDVDSVTDLIDALQDSDPRVRRGALWALQEITGLRFENDPERWSGWYAEETRWLEGRAGDLAAAAMDPDPGRAVAALRELAQHSLFGRELVPDVAAAVQHESPEVAAYACGALARLRHPSALAPLVEALDDPRDEVSGAALKSLQVLTGKRGLPASSAAWAEWAEGAKKG